MYFYLAKKIQYGSKWSLQPVTQGMNPHAKHVRITITNKTIISLRCNV